jgi:biopolymer transport protein TolR
MAMNSGDKANINVTPMIDVLLVLLIIFMLIGPPHSTGLPAESPQPASGNGNGREIVVSVAEDRSLKINADPVSWEELAPSLEKIFLRRAEKVLFVKGAPQADFADVASVLDVARSAGIERVALLPSR